MAAADFDAEVQKGVNASAPLDPGIWAEGNMDVYYGKLTLTGQVKSKSHHMFTAPAGFVPLMLFMNGPTLASSKIGVGISGTAAKYRASGIFTAISEIAMLANLSAALATDTEIWVTNSADDVFPAAGTLVVGMIGRRA